MGYALDGFGIYGQRGEGGAHISNADLDVCPGHTHQIEWDGQQIDLFHYHATDEFPYTVGCFRGRAAQMQPGGGASGPPPGAGGPGMGPPPGGPSPRQPGGPGIAVEDQPHVFERFWRADPSRVRKTGGSGLAIVASLVQAHGGAITVQSAPGAGAAFTITLPLLAGEALTPALSLWERAGVRALPEPASAIIGQRGSDASRRRGAFAVSRDPC